MFEWVFVVLITLNGQVAGMMTVHSVTEQLCEGLQHGMVEDSFRIPKTSPLQTLVGPCAKNADS